MAAKSLSKSKLRFPIDSQNRDLLFALLGYDGSIETVTSGALSLSKKTSLLSISGTKAYTLAAGEFEGQRKRVVVTVAGSTPVGTLTVTGPTATFVFNEVGQAIELEYHVANGWTRVDSSKTLGSTNGIETVTSGAISVLTRSSKISVDGTKAYTLAAGTEGQRKTLKCSAATNTPAGTITLTSPDCSTISISATSHWVELEYHATGGWAVLQYAGVTLNA